MRRGILLPGGLGLLRRLQLSLPQSLLPGLFQSLLLLGVRDCAGA